MRYFYVDQLNRPAGPVEASVLCEAIISGVLSPDSLIAEEYTDVWQPLVSLLPFYFSQNGETAGPASLAEIHEAARAAQGPVLICPPGGSSWHPLPGASLSSVPPALPVVAATPVYATPRALTQPAVPAGQKRLRTSILAAGAIWIAAGACKVVDTLIAAVSLFSPAPEPAVVVLSLLILLLSTAIGLAFLLTGLGTMRSRPGNLVRRGIYSIICGIISLSVAILDAQRPPEGEAGQFDDITTAVTFILGTLLIIAGIIALSHHRNPWAQARKARPQTAPRRK